MLYVQTVQNNPLYVFSVFFCIFGCIQLILPVPIHADLTFETICPFHKLWEMQFLSLQIQNLMGGG